MSLGPFPEELFPFEAENAAPQPFQIDRHDRGVGPVEDFHHARLEGLHLAGARQAPFGKDADQLAALRALRGPSAGRRRSSSAWAGRSESRRTASASRLIHGRFSMFGAQAIIRIGRELVSISKMPSIQVTWFGTSRRPAFARQILAAEDPNAIDRQAQQPDEKANRRLRNQEARCRRRPESSQAGEQKNLLRRKTARSGVARLARRPASAAPRTGTTRGRCR